MTAEDIVARLHRRIVELEEAADLAAHWRDKAGEIATFEKAVEAYGEWERQRREYLYALRELRTLVEEPDALDAAKREGDRLSPETDLEIASAWGK